MLQARVRNGSGDEGKGVRVPVCKKYMDFWSEKGDLLTP